ncbi:iron ABC transporter permease [Halomonas denitrificans]|uniref:FecCD family ABC transporter permease n=1 Tax=Halomonas TaxID=2745 RepID=UPI001A8FD4E4|nr:MULTISPECIES: iron ABC transporter permease [Halomonas]MBN8413132.1 iron ABC transporter permease [Halomonas litopenaei]MCA0975057.1 iron ABC transporter permease [Halomonas denitrificans]
MSLHRLTPPGALTWWLAAALVAAALLSIGIGTRDTGWTTLLGLTDGSVDSMAEAAVASRLPRTLLAILAGASLAVAGAGMQGLTRNPLADPGLLGVNAGASLAVVIGIAWFAMQHVAEYLWVAVLGAAISALVVYLIASLSRGGPTPLRLALSGAVMSAALASLTSAIILPRSDIAGLLHSWLIGGVGGATLDRILPVLPLMVLGMILTLSSARRLNLMALGDDTATGLGERVAQARWLAASGAILLCGATTAACGPIGFVGLVVPHALRMMTGSDYRRLLPLSALGGALLVTLADTLGRVLVSPAELDVGIVTALVGGPVFIAIVRRHQLRSL